MQKITNIEIKNFKSIRHQKIDDCRRINVFIGYPNVGKSNILEALSVFSINEAKVDFSTFIRMEDLTTLFYNGEINQQSEIKINEKHRVVVRLVNDTLSFEQQFEKEETSFEYKNSRMVTLDNSADVSIVKSFNVEEKDKQISNFHAGALQRQDELSEVRKYQFLKNTKLSGKNYSSLSYPSGDNIFNIISTNKNLKNEVAQFFNPYSLELLYDTRLQRFEILKRTILGIFTVPYTMIADTIQRLIFYKAAILSNKEKVLLFEEPEAHMFPPYISKFTSDIIHDENHNQFFIATHSPFVMNDLISSGEKDELSIYIVSYENESGETLIYRMSEEEVDETYQFGYDFFMNINNFIPQKEHG